MRLNLQFCFSSWISPESVSLLPFSLWSNFQQLLSLQVQHFLTEFVFSTAGGWGEATSESKQTRESDIENQTYAFPSSTGRRRMNLSGEMTKTIVGRNIRIGKSDKEKWNYPLGVRKVSDKRKRKNSCRKSQSKKNERESTRWSNNKKLKHFKAQKKLRKVF